MKYEKKNVEETYPHTNFQIIRQVNAD